MVPSKKSVDLVRAEMQEPVDPRVAAMAAAIAAPYGSAAQAVIFYGSCLRESQLDEMMLDFYLIVSGYRRAYGKGWYSFANRILPPNVFPFSHDGLVAKYAVLNEADLRLGCGQHARDVSVWARFAQPVRLAWVKNDHAGKMVVDCIARAAPTLIAYAKPMTESDDAVEVFKHGFELTYSCELRAERDDRPGKIVDREPERYRAFYAAAHTPPLPVDAEIAWKNFRRRGKRLSVLRLSKAVTTFSGGADYLAWKINRHAGTKIEIRPWQRRWPLLGALVLVPKLLRQGAIR
jgi:hypothetical protein